MHLTLGWGVADPRKHHPPPRVTLPKSGSKDLGDAGLCPLEWRRG